VGIGLVGRGFAFAVPFPFPQVTHDGRCGMWRKPWVGRAKPSHDTEGGEHGDTVRSCVGPANCADCTITACGTISVRSQGGIQSGPPSELIRLVAPAAIRCSTASAAPAAEPTAVATGQPNGVATWPLPSVRPYG